MSSRRAASLPLPRGLLSRGPALLRRALALSGGTLSLLATLLLALPLRLRRLVLLATLSVHG